MRGMNRNLAIAFVLLISLVYPAKSGGTDFVPSKTYAVGTSPSAVVVGDFNGDGKPDLAVANSGSGNVSILLGSGNGTFQPASNFDAGMSKPSVLAIGDFNHDGKVDLAVFQPGDSTNGVAGAVSILLGNGDGTFQAAKTTSLTAQAASIAVGDFNSDGKSDIVIGDIDATAVDLTLNLFSGKGDGTFLAPRALSTFSSWTVALLAADLNGDGNLDLAVGSSASSVSILLGKGDGTFQQAPGGAMSTPLPPLSLQAADLTGDGKADLVVKSFRASGTQYVLASSNLSAFVGNGDGSFQAGQTVFSARSFIVIRRLSYTLGDYNGDKKLDLVYTYGSLTNEVLGRGTGAFSVPVPVDLAGDSVAFAADLNGDGLSDLLTLGPGDAISVFLNTSPTAGVDLGIVQAGASPEPVGVGTSLTYTAAVLNQGPKDATGVTFTDTLPNGVSFVSASSSQGSCVQSHGIATCSMGPLKSAFDATVTIVGTPAATGTISNTMNVAGTETDLAMANNAATQSSTVVPVYILGVTKSGNGSGTIMGDPALNGTINCGTTCSATYLSGTTANLGDNIDPGSLLQSWGGACAGTPSNSGCSVTMDSDKTVTATIVLGVKLNVTIAGTGTGSVTSSDGSVNCIGGICSQLYLPGSSLSLTAAASGNSTFAGWSGACTGSDPSRCSVTLNSDQTVTAMFNIPPDFTVSPAAPSLSLKHGGQASDQLNFLAEGGFSGTIALACSVTGLTPLLTCGVSPNSVTPGNGATLTVTAPALTAALVSRNRRK
jgi:uncharacterized repeat protein (TIGR01451 family)